MTVRPSQATFTPDFTSAVNSSWLCRMAGDSHHQPKNAAGLLRLGSRCLFQLLVSHCAGLEC